MLCNPIVYANYSSDFFFRLDESFSVSAATNEEKYKPSLRYYAHILLNDRQLQWESEIHFTHTLTCTF